MKPVRCSLACMCVFAALVGRAGAEPSDAPAAPGKPETTPATAAGLGTILDAEAKVVRIVSGRRFTEGPLFAAGLGIGDALLFTDIPADTVYVWKPGAGGKLVESEPEVFLKPSGNANGLAKLPGPPHVLGPRGNSRLVLAQHAGALALRGKADSPLTPLVERFEGKRLNSPNDMALRANRDVYFTDPPYGVGKRSRELDFSGVYRFDASNNLTLLVRDLPTPNGLDFSPDEHTLYIADSSLGEIHAFPVQPDGTLGERRVFAQVKRPAADPKEDPPAKPRSAFPDGLKVDRAGNVYCAAFGGVWVFSPDGTRLGIIETPEQPSNLCFGFNDDATGGPVLFITARTSVYAVPVKIRGRS